MNTEIEIIVNGKPVRQHKYEGNTFIEARVGTEYTIKVKNSSSSRKLAVITVDGVNVITGQPQTDNGVGEGYVINSYDAVDIRGFRKDMSSVGAFKFCQAGNSYCNEQGLKGNNGVIGVRIYDEVISIINIPFIVDKNKISEPSNPWPKPEPYKPYWGDTTIICNSDGLTKGTTSNSTSEITFGGSVNYCSTQSSSNNNVLRSCNNAPKFDVGTTWGKQINDSAVNVPFKCTATYEEYIIYYDSRKNLEKMGIKFKKETEVCYPKAFGAFATPPRGWTGK